METWAGRSDFKYSGSVETGTEIFYGKNNRYKATVTQEQYRALLQKFIRRVVPVGTSRTNPPQESLGFWLKENVTKTAIASYVAPILIHEGYAKRDGDHDIQIVK